MKQLSTKQIERTYYVNENIIYDIKNTTKPTTDIHAIIYKSPLQSGCFPYVYYMDLKGDEYTYYLDSLIKDGDKLIERTFSIVCHDIEGEPELSPFNYFKYLCEQQIAQVITDNYKRGYKYFYDPDNGVDNLNLLGVPLYMLKQKYDDLINGSNFRECDGSQTTRVTKDKVIDFSEEKYNELLQNEILRRATKAASDAVQNYDKKVCSVTLVDSQDECS